MGTRNADRSSAVLGVSMDARAARAQEQAVSPGPPIEFANLTKSEILKLEGSCGHKAYECELNLIASLLDTFLAAPAGR